MNNPNEIIVKREFPENSDVQTTINLMAGSRLRNYRDQAGYTQQYVAEKLGVSETNITRHENGKQALTIPLLLKYSWFYHISMDDLLYGVLPGTDMQRFYVIGVVGDPLTEKQQQYLTMQIQHMTENCKAEGIQLEVRRTSEAAQDLWRRICMEIYDLSDLRMMILRCLWNSEKSLTLTALTEAIKSRYSVSFADQEYKEAIEDLVAHGYVNQDAGTETDMSTGDAADREISYQAGISEKEFNRKLRELQEELWTRMC